jgi:radical SAM protein with 4Fe4S-binding SPASM domain
MTAERGTQNGGEPRAARPGAGVVAVSRVRLAAAFSRGEARVGYPPLYLWIEPTNRCNLRCPMCPQSDGLKRPFGAMDIAMFERIVRQAAGKVQLMSLHFAGEPLLNKELPAMVGLASGAGIPTVIHSNGTLMDAETGGRLIDAGLDQIVFSFDAVPESDYALKRPPAKFDETLRRIREFLEEKKRRGSRKPFVTIKSVVFFDPGSPTPDTGVLKRLFGGLPVDRFAVERAHTFAGDFAGAVLKEKRYGVMDRGEVSGCALPWYGFSIAWNGEAFACCNDLNGEYALGNVNEQSILEIWNGSRMVSLRKQLSAKELGGLQLCASCDAVHRKTSLRDIAVEFASYSAKFILRK